MATGRLAAISSGILALMLVVGCKVSVPDVDTQLFACKSGNDCASGYSCWMPVTATNGIGWCTRGGTAVDICGDTYCTGGEVCVQDSSSSNGGLSCRQACAKDNDCTGNGSKYMGCGNVTSREGKDVGACVTCPSCSNGLQCYKRGAGPHDWTRATYCNKSGDTCVAGTDSEGDGATYCEDSDCYFSGHCTCGNFQLDSGEVCDGYLMSSSATCPANTVGTVHCTSSCTLDTSDCFAAPVCNNGSLEAGEACDGTHFANGNACGGYVSGTTGTVTCNSNCTVNTSTCSSSSTCGNGSLDASEACDGGLFRNGNACGSYVSGTTGTVTCVNCTVVTTACSATNLCGNGSINAGEDCDGVNYNGQSCATLSSDFSTGSLTCNSDCSYNVSSCQATNPRCGLCEDASGNLLATNECSSAYCATRPECATWAIGSPNTASLNTYSMAVAVSISVAWLVWQENNNSIFAQGFNADGTQATTKYSVAGGTSVKDVAVAIADNGLPMVAWTDLYAGSNRLYLRVFNGSTFNAVTGTSDNGYGVLTDINRSIKGTPAFSRIGSAQNLALAAALDNGDIAVWNVTKSSVDAMQFLSPGNGSGEVAVARSPITNETLIVYTCNGGQVCAAFLSPGSSVWAYFDGNKQLTSSALTDFSPGAGYTSYGAPIVSWGSNDLNGSVYAKLRRYGTWTLLTNTAGTTYSIQAGSLTAASTSVFGDRPIVAWAYPSGSNSTLQARFWEGDARGWRATAGSACAGAALLPVSLGATMPALGANQLNTVATACLGYYDLTMGPRVACHVIP